MCFEPKQSDSYRKHVFTPTVCPTTIICPTYTNYHLFLANTKWLLKKTFFHTNDHLKVIYTKVEQVGVGYSCLHARCSLLIAAKAA